jgi:hypothetical protein
LMLFFLNPEFLISFSSLFFISSSVGMFLFIVILVLTNFLIALGSAHGKEIQESNH